MVAVKQKILGMDDICIKGKKYSWNSAYNVYNGPHYEQLQQDELEGYLKPMLVCEPSDERRYGLDLQYLTKEDIDDHLRDSQINPDDYEIDYDGIAFDTFELMDQDFGDYIQRIMHDNEGEYFKDKAGNKVNPYD